jgi:hypothetical protein
LITSINSLVCPQIISSLSRYTKEDETGSCVIWSYYYLWLRLHNPLVPIADIQRHISRMSPDQTLDIVRRMAYILHSEIPANLSPMRMTYNEFIESHNYVIDTDNDNNLVFTYPVCDIKQVCTAYNKVIYSLVTDKVVTEPTMPVIIVNKIRRLMSSVLLQRDLLYPKIVATIENYQKLGVKLNVSTSVENIYSLQQLYGLRRQEPTNPVVDAVLFKFGIKAKKDLGLRDVEYSELLSMANIIAYPKVLVDLYYTVKDTIP